MRNTTDVDLNRVRLRLLYRQVKAGLLDEKQLTEKQKWLLNKYYGESLGWR